jgi:hypothetical protein
MKAWIIFIAFLVGTAALGIATYLTPAGAGRLMPFGLTCLGIGFTVGSVPG